MRNDCSEQSKQVAEGENAAVHVLLCFTRTSEFPKRIKRFAGHTFWSSFPFLPLYSCSLGLPLESTTLFESLSVSDGTKTKTSRDSKE